MWSGEKKNSGRMINIFYMDIENGENLFNID